VSRFSSLPGDPQRILLVDPTRYLGNLLLAGALLQQYAAHCAAHKRDLLLVLDESFAELCASAFPGLRVLYYPRHELARTGALDRLSLYWRFLKEIRRFRADLAFNLEEDTVSTRLVQLSGARFRLGCSPLRQNFGFEHVLPIDYAVRVPGRRHRWYSFQEVFAALGLPELLPSYMNLHINQLDNGFFQKLERLGVDFSRPVVAVHPGATKPYKQWPEFAFIELCNLLIKNNIQPVILGAGSAEAVRCASIVEGIGGSTSTRPVNLCNHLSLRELAGFFMVCAGSVGNDSGPSHLAAAQGLPGVVIFGPSDAEIWGPLGTASRVLQRRDLCAPGCSRRACLADYSCLRGISPTSVVESLLQGKLRSPLNPLGMETEISNITMPGESSP